jgi:hypothetical protein
MGVFAFGVRSRLAFFTLLLLLAFQNFSMATSFPGATRTLASFGAVGNGLTDDTAALKSAFSSARDYCLDGGGKTYQVRGMLGTNHSLCLKNAILRQTMTPIDTSVYIRSAARTLPLLGAEDVLSFPEDPVLTDAQNTELKLRTSLRTIYVRGDAFSTVVVLDGVKIRKGSYDELGNAGDSAAIYIVSTPTVSITNVEISGKGQGYGILISGADKLVRIDGLNLHDIHWRLAKGNPSYSLNEMRDKWHWNNVPLYTYRDDLKKFVVVRSQERSSGLVISHCNNVEIANTRISEILYMVDGVGIPWQADGMTIGRSTNVKIHDSSVSQTWEGIDITGSDDPGQGVGNFQIDRVKFSNNFFFGLKIVHAAHSGWVRDIVVRNAGQYGVVVAGPVHDIVLSGLNIAGFGVLNLRDGYQLRLGLNVPTAAVGIETYGRTDRALNPEHVRVVDSTLVTSDGNVPDFGIHVDLPQYMTHIVAGANNIAGYHLAAQSGLMTTAYSYEAVQSAYRQLLGCDGTLKGKIWAWDQSSNSVRNPTWQLSDLQNYIRSSGSCL